MPHLGELYAHEVEELTKRLEELETKEQDSQDASDGCIDEELKKTVLYVNIYYKKSTAFQVLIVWDASSSTIEHMCCLYHVGIKDSGFEIPCAYHVR